MLQKWNQSAKLLGMIPVRSVYRLPQELIRFRLDFFTQILGKDWCFDPLLSVFITVLTQIFTIWLDLIRFQLDFINLWLDFFNKIKQMSYSIH